MAKDLPTGTVTFLFTDIEGSTRLWEEHPDEMAASLERHDGIVRSAIEGHGGYVFATGGDGFAAVFAAAGDAVAAGVDIQLGLVAQLGPLVFGVRVGVHTGEAAERDGDYFGSAVNRAARLMSIGHGGQVLVSDTTERLNGERVSLRSLGEHRLRDLGERMGVFQVVADGLRSEFPALQSLDAFAGNLPQQFSSFVGREEEQKDLAGRVAEHRLVTLIGVGGTGKTRLAVQTAAGLITDFDDGAWLVELGLVQSEGAVAEGVAAALGARPAQGQTFEDCLVEYLQNRTVLLILDNCEHILSGAAEIADGLLRSCPSTRIVATSREALMVSGEQIMPLAPLALAHEGREETSDAAELLIERVRSERGDFDPSASEREAIETICAQLDGMPLAIELAASRCRSLGVSEVASHLDERFRLLTGGRRTGVERHQTLQAAVDWSYNLLDQSERDVFDRLAVFVGDFRTEDAVAITAADGLGQFVVLDALASLVDKSMCTANLDGEPATYRYLETMRAYGRTHLEQGGLLSKYRDRHAAHFGLIAEAANKGIVGPDERETERDLDDRWADIRAALDWAVETGHGDVVGHIADVAIAVGWRGTYAPMRWFLLLAEQTQAWPLAQDAAVGGAFFAGNDLDEVMRIADRAIQDRNSERRPPTIALMASGYAAWVRGDSEETLRRHQRLYDSAKDDQDIQNRFWATWPLATTLAMLGRDTQDLIDNMIEEVQANDWPTAMAYALYSDGQTKQHSDPQAAIASWKRGLSIAQEVDNSQLIAIARRELLGLQLDLLPTDELAAELIALLRHLQAIGNTLDLNLAVSHTVKVLAREGKLEQAGILTAWLDGRSGGSQDDHQALEDIADQVATQLDNAADLVAQGLAMSPNEATDYACQALATLA